MSISLSSVTKIFGSERAVDGLSAEVRRGEFFVVLGPSGCGKSTLLRLIAGLEELDGGEVALDGRAVAGPGLHLAPEERRVSVVFQSYALWPHMTVTGNVAFPMEAQGMGGAEARRAAAGHLETVELTSYAERRPAELSGGQRQRVALARCLASGAATILMDEPLANLDPYLRDAMEHELRGFHRESGATTLYITHDQREAMALADRIAVMRQGRFEQVAAPHDVYARPASRFVADFVGTGGVLRGEVMASGEGRCRVRCGGFEVDAECDGTPSADATVEVLVRPEWLAAASEGQPARIDAVSYRGGVWECQARIDGQSDPLVFRSNRAVSPGETVPLGIARGWVLPG